MSLIPVKDAIRVLYDVLKVFIQASFNSHNYETFS